MTLSERVVDWLDPDWFQAVGSVVAVAAGFAYVALQTILSDRSLRRSQRMMRSHVTGLADSILRYQDEVRSIFAQSAETGTPLHVQHSDKAYTALVSELMATPVADVGNPAFAMAARRLAGNAFAFGEIAAATGASVATRDTIRHLEHFNSVARNSRDTLERLNLGLARRSPDHSEAVE